MENQHVIVQIEGPKQANSIFLMEDILAWVKKCLDVANNKRGMETETLLGVYDGRFEILGFEPIGEECIITDALVDELSNTVEQRRIENGAPFQSDNIAIHFRLKNI